MKLHTPLGLGLLWKPTVSIILAMTLIKMLYLFCRRPSRSRYMVVTQPMPPNVINWLIISFHRQCKHRHPIHTHSIPVKYATCDESSVYLVSLQHRYSNLNLAPSPPRDYCGIYQILALGQPPNSWSNLFHSVDTVITWVVFLNAHPMAVWNLAVVLLVL